MKASTPELLKFQKLQRRLKESRRGTIGLLEGMWLGVGKNCPQGDIGRFSNEEIAIICDWDGDPDELIDALVDCRWLDQCDENRLVVHDWGHHCPTYIKGGLARSGSEIVQAKVGPKAQAKAGPKVQAEMAPERGSGCSHKLPSTKPIQAKPIQAAICSEADEPPSEPKLDPSLVMFPEFPCSGPEGSQTWRATALQLSEWAEAYPAVNVPSEMRKAHAWIKANLGKRKTKGGMPKFITNWLARTQDSPARPSSHQSAAPISKPLAPLRPREVS